MVSTMASGTAPIAARSLTLVRTAAIPGAVGVCGHEGREQRLAAGDDLVGDPSGRWQAGRGGHDGAVVARAMDPAAGAQDLTDQPDLALRAQRGVGSQEAGQLLESVRSFVPVLMAAPHG